MALVFKEYIAQGTLLGVWKKEEELELLQTVFPLRSEEKISFNKISNIPRKKEWLTTRILLTEMFEKRKLISYSENKKPYLKDSNLNLTISHSSHFVAIIISNHYQPGVDIEHISERVQNIKHKFLSTTELSWCNTIPLLTACWSAKEAVFKIFEKELDFKDMEINPFQLENEKGHFDSSILKSNPPIQLKIDYLFFEDHILTYALKRSDINFS